MKRKKILFYSSILLSSFLIVPIISCERKIRQIENSQKEQEKHQASLDNSSIKKIEDDLKAEENKKLELEQERLKQEKIKAKQLALKEAIKKKILEKKEALRKLQEENKTLQEKIKNKDREQENLKKWVDKTQEENNNKNSLITDVNSEINALTENNQKVNQEQIKSELQIEYEKLLVEQQKIIRKNQTNDTRPLIDVLKQFTLFSLSEDLPAKLFDFLDEYLLKLALRIRIDEDIKKQIRKSFEFEKINQTFKWFINDTLKILRNINLKSDDDGIIEQVKQEVIKILPDYIYRFLDLAIEVMAKPAVKRSGTQTSLLTEIILDILEKKELPIFSVKSETTKVLYQILHLFVDFDGVNSKSLINHFVDTAREIARNFRFTLNISNDFIQIINQTIWALFRNSDGSVSWNKIFDNILPRFFEDIEVEDENLDIFVDFLNRLFVDFDDSIYKFLNIDLALPDWRGVDAIVESEKKELINKLLREKDQIREREKRLEENKRKNIIKTKMEGPSVISKNDQIKPEIISARFEEGTSRALSQTKQNENVESIQLNFFKIPKLKPNLDTIIHLLFNHKKYTTLIWKMLTKIFDPYVRAFIRDVKKDHQSITASITKIQDLINNTNSNSLNNFNLQINNNIKTKGSFKALFRIVVFMTQLIYKGVNFNKNLVFERYLNINPIALQNLIPNILIELFQKYISENELKTLNIGYVIHELFGNLDKNDSWKQVINHVKYLFTGRGFGEIDNVFYWIEKRDKEKLKRMLKLGYYFDGTIPNPSYKKGN
ncbi:hypothetical protein QLQ80_00575 [Mycoplasma sp. M5725]|uniref:Uncharacterized protein n=1 Tax=Mycoplasma phocimorsus TaxID=3045839 RepID=A0AAJ1UWL8_9MOLU|nr:hypothetical protein [Mycoplasma phocimorsus]MDJ1645585.1 hypothetical protein [Mycoplasma phocimorsus]MDJ1646153.1 hypothetical protein [Mycoplasma phocimorsus]